VCYLFYDEMIRYLSMLGSPKYIPPVTSSISITPATSPSVPDMYFRTPIVTQSSTKLSGSGGENWMIPPHHGTLWSSWICSSILDLHTDCIAAVRHLQACGRWQVVACPNLDISRHDSLRHIFTVETEICSHNPSWPCC
jgi:hypothetical protein